MLTISVSPPSDSSDAVPRLIRSSSADSNARCAGAISTTARFSSSWFAVAVSLGPAATSVPLPWATPKAAASSGTVPRVTRFCESPTWAKANRATRLAASVNAAAPPIAT